MATNASEIPVSINYTGRDYYSLREELIARVQNRVDTWTGDDPADFGLALIEAFAYLGDVMSYYIDRNANESFISTATQRSSVLSLAETYGYKPAGYRQAEVELLIQNTSGNNLTLPSGTVVSGDLVIGDTVETVYFTVNEDIQSLVSIDDGDVNIPAYHGRSISLINPNSNEYGELIGVSNQTPNPYYELSQSPVVTGSVSVYVEDGTSFSKWREVDKILDYGPYDQVFSTFTDEYGVMYVLFGDGISGQLPTNQQQIRALYTVGGGEIGNIPPSTLDTLVYVPGLTNNQLIALQSLVTVSNVDTGIGGSDPETTEQIRAAAPASLTANGRGVTLKDFAKLALGTSGVGIAAAVADIWTSVTVYIAPSRSSTSSDLAPGLDELGNPSTEYLQLKNAVEPFLNENALIGTTVTVQPPTYVDVVVSIEYTKQPQYTTAEVELAIKKVLVEQFGYVYRTFNEEITVQDVEYYLQQIPGVKARLLELHREGDTGLQTLQASNGELFRFQEDNFNISAAV